jgi:RNA-binding protein YlmH
MADNNLLKQTAELHDRCLRSGVLTHTNFLTPAEAAEVTALARRLRYDNLVLFGGAAGVERVVAFFLPDYLDEEHFDREGAVNAVRAVSRFASPGHRDYLGAILALGIRREFLGDIFIDGETAHFFCLPSVLQHIILNLDHVGRAGVSAEAVSLAAVPVPVRKTDTKSFTVKSARLDAVAAGMFSASRSAMAELIAQGLVTHNYTVSLKPDAGVCAGDVLSVRGRGKGRVLDIGGESRKGRAFVTAEIYQ